jgi:hypothetical protein
MIKLTLNWLFNFLFGFKKIFDIALENLALRQHLAAMKRSIKRILGDVLNVSSFVPQAQNFPQWRCVYRVPRTDRLR